MTCRADIERSPIDGRGYRFTCTCGAAGPWYSHELMAIEDARHHEHGGDAGVCEVCNGSELPTPCYACRGCQPPPDPLHYPHTAVNRKGTTMYTIHRYKIALTDHEVTEVYEPRAGHTTVREFDGVYLGRLTTRPCTDPWEDGLDYGTPERIALVRAHYDGLRAQEAAIVAAA